MKDVPFLFPTGPWVGRMQYAPTTGYVRPFKKLSRFRPLRGRGVGVCDTPLRPGTCDPSKYRCNFPAGYVLSFKKLSRFRPLRGRGVGRMRYTPTTGYLRSFEIPMRSSNRLRAALQKCGPSKNCPVFVSFGAVCGAYSIRPYDWVCAILRNTDTISRPEGRGFLGGGAVGATVCGGDGRE